MQGKKLLIPQTFDLQMIAVFLYMTTFSMFQEGFTSWLVWYISLKAVLK
jgi:hypothetical protein